MQCVQSGPCRPMRRDPDSKWVQLARTRRNNPASMSETISPTSTSSTSTSPRSITPPNIKDAGHLRSRSSATSYFALLSAAEDANRDGRSLTHQKQHHGRPSSRHMDSLWASWFADTGNQRPPADLSDERKLETRNSSTQSFVHFTHSRAPSETPSLQMSENTVGTTAASSTSSTNPPSTISASVGATTPLQSSPVTFLDADIDGLNTFPEFSSTFPFDLNETTANVTFDPAELDAGLLTWLDQQPTLPFGLNEETSKSSPKRALEVYPTDSSKAGPISLENKTSKKQKIFHSWTEGIETALPFSPQW